MGFKRNSTTPCEPWQELTEDQQFHFLLYYNAER